MPFTTHFIDTDGVTDLGSYKFLEKSFLMDVYPGLMEGIRSSGLYASGLNDSGQLADNTVTNKSSPVQTVSGGSNWKQISAGSSFVGAIKNDGTLWMWGSNSAGQLGDGTITPRSSPVQTISGGTDWVSVSCGAAATGAIKADGTLWLWGLSGLGTLGDGTIISKSSPVQTIAGGTDWKQISVSQCAAAIKNDGTLWLWGTNVNGILGDNTTVSKSSPVQTITGGTNWKSVSAGTTMAAIKTDGTLWTWGLGTSGELGDNTIVSKSSPVQTIAGGTNWKSVSSGNNHITSIKTDGTLWAWGNNSSGALGDNSTTNKSSPVQTVTTGTNWKTVASGNGFTTALKVDGTLWTWGLGTSGQLGDLSVTSKSSPVQTSTGGTNWKSISANTGFFVSISESGGF